MWSWVIEALSGADIEWWGGLGCGLQVIVGVSRYRVGRGGIMIWGWFDNMPIAAQSGGAER